MGLWSGTVLPTPFPQVDGLPVCPVGPAGEPPVPAPVVGAAQGPSGGATAFHLRHGHLASPATEKLDGYAVGAWMRRQRKAEGLTSEQAAALTGLDGLWRLEPDWNRSYRRLLVHLAAGATLDGPANRTGLGDDPTFRPGTWPRKQAGARTEGKLTDHQAALLDAVTPHAETVTG
ncbi:helicase associated domain-containing protein [Kitasatospora sp. NPDC059827]|uniref:helicase associated domain-containing protein n=1 Tax=Kitasatospora sp. NPDC059827 TaxID=3346964 RepID=UPI00365B389E